MLTCRRLASHSRCAAITTPALATRLGITTVPFCASTMSATGVIGEIGRFDDHRGDDFHVAGVHGTLVAGEDQHVAPRPAARFEPATSVPASGTSTHLHPNLAHCRRQTAAPRRSHAGQRTTRRASSLALRRFVSPVPGPRGSPPVRDPLYRRRLRLANYAGQRHGFPPLRPAPGIGLKRAAYSPCIHPANCGPDATSGCRTSWNGPSRGCRRRHRRG